MRIGIIIGIALATFAVSYAWHRNPQGSGQRGQPSDGATAALASPAGLPSAGEAMTPFEAPAPAVAALPEGDTTGLLRESVTLDDLLLEVNDESAEGFTPVDRDLLADQLRSDPALHEIVGD